MQAAYRYHGRKLMQLSAGKGPPSKVCCGGLGAWHA
jgi:hypothetical protein